MSTSISVINKYNITWATLKVNKTIMFYRHNNLVHENMLFCVFNTWLLWVCLCSRVFVVTGDNSHVEVGKLLDLCKDVDPIIVSPGGVFRGSWMQSRRGRKIQAYRGIRYAEPPVGELRFKPPKLIESFDGVVDATKDGPACPQPGNGTFDEDCLMLNVYTPSNIGSALLPVIVYIHPGGFYQYSGRSDAAGPEYLLDKDVVFVAINYRLGSLGFLAMGTKEAPGNIGYKDQVAALKWVSWNIAAFGGDPHLVTVAGCSSGALSVIGHMISPMSTGLFHRAISISGSPTSKVPSPSDRLDLAVKQALISNCPSTSPKEIYDCLMTKPWQDIATNVMGFREFGTDPISLWRTNVELDFGQERFLPVDPIEAVRAGPITDVPTLLSQTRDEFFWKSFATLENATLRTTLDAEWEHYAPISLVLPRDNSTAQVRALRLAYLGDRRLEDDALTADGLGKLYADAISAFAVYRLGKLMCRHSKQPVWYYEFDYTGNRSYYENNTTKEPIGVAHQDDTLYLLTNRNRFPIIAADNSEDSKMVDKMVNIWYNFAKYGDPNPVPEVSWPPLSCDRRQYLRLAAHFTIQEKLKEDRFTLWDELYPIQY